MAIDLSGLELADVQITVQGNSILVRTQKEDCIEDMRSLPSPIKCNFYTRNKMVSVEPHGTDTIALAERLATTWEGREYKVTRKVTPLHSLDGKQVQSFILA